MTNAGADPPDGGMEEEECFGDGLQDVPEEVGAAHVGQFVGENDFELVGAKQSDGAEREQNDGAKCAHCHGAVDGGGETERDRRG